MQNIDFETDNINYSIIPYIDKSNYVSCEYDDTDCLKKLDCAKSRTLSNLGVYSCFAITGDHRGRCAVHLMTIQGRIILKLKLAASVLNPKRTCLPSIGTNIFSII